jgi:hypothetical protein
VTPAGLQIELRAAGSERYFSSLLRDLGLGDLVRLLPPLDYHAALRDCAEADGLLLLQGPSCDRQIPAKTYEYLRLGKPILALTTPEGDTAGVLSECGGATIVDLLDQDALYHALPLFLESLRRGRHPLPDPAKTAQYARHNQAYELAACLADITAPAVRRIP